MLFVGSIIIPEFGTLPKGVRPEKFSSLDMEL